MYLIVSGSDTCISQWSGIRGGMSAGVTWEHGEHGRHIALGGGFSVIFIEGISQCLKV